MPRFYEVSRGTARIVVSLPWLGLAFKFAIIVPQYSFGSLWRSHESLWREAWLVLRRPWRLRKNWHWLSAGCERAVNGWKSFIRKSGVTHNIVERGFYKRATCLELMLLQPTYFSLLGLVNVQKYGRPSSKEYDGAAYYLSHLALRGIHHYNGHHFNHAWNYTGLEEGRVRLLDYGSTWVQDNIGEGALRLLQQFDPATIRDEYEFYEQWAETEREKERNTPERIAKRIIRWMKACEREEKMLRLCYNIPDNEPIPPDFDLHFPFFEEFYD